MPHSFFCICPVCNAEDSLKEPRCSNCKTKIQYKNNSIYFEDTELAFSDYYDLLYEKLQVEEKASSHKEVKTKVKSNKLSLLRVSKKTILRQGESTIEFKGYHNIFRQVLEKPKKICEGILFLYPDYVEFKAEKNNYKWLAKEFTCVTTNGHYFEFKIRHRPFFQIYFREESPLKYEIIFRKWLNEFYQSDKKMIKIYEYQPVVRCTIPHQGHGYLKISKIKKEEKEFWLEKLIFAVIEPLPKLLFKLLVKITIYQKENWSKNSKGIVLVNHQSALDPFIIGVFLDRKIAYLTKSTSFAHWLPRFCLKWLRALPATRYQTDNQILYTIRKILNRYIKVGIFPEGERTWAGKLRPFKLSTVKVLMASRQAIYPVVLKKAFDFWPRWTRFPGRASIEIHVEAPFSLIPFLYSVDEQRQFLETYFKKVLNE